MSDVYPWYERVVIGDDSLAQGDLIRNCPILIPPSEVTEGKVLVGSQEFDVVVLSQSCDLENRKVNLVLVSPVWPISVVSKSSKFNSPKAFDKFVEKVLRGEQPNYHLLSKCALEGIEHEAKFVDFQNVYGVHISALVEIAKRTERVRLLPPYREHLSQAFARFFMRVGLPSRVEID